MAQRGRPRKNAAQEAYTKAAQGLYKAYCLYVHNMDFFANPNAKEEDMKWKPSKFHKDLCDRVQEFVEKETDKAFEIMIINTPPQHGKSTTITQTLPSWYLMKHPDNCVIQVSYGDDLAERFGKRNLEKVKEHGHIFGIEVDPKKSTSKEFEILNHTGRMISRGIGSGVTGHSGHLILIDDPIKNREQADSERIRDSVWAEFTDSIISRTQAGSKIILIMTRWHEDDLAGRILEEMPDVVTYVNYECECESDEDPLGREKRHTLEDGTVVMGEPLCPEIGKGAKWLEEFKKIHISDKGRRSWEALYQGHPTIMEGNLLKKSWWRYYRVEDFFKGTLRFDQLVASLDATFKDGEKNDYVALEIWGKVENRFYLVDLVNEHLDFANTVKKLRLFIAKYAHLGAIYVEDKANGPAIITTLKNEVAGIIPVSPDASKESRVNAIQFLVEAGNVYLPEDREFTRKFVEQCARFPNAKHDDMVDSMSMALSKLHYSRKGALRRKLQDASGWILPSDKPVRRVDVGGSINVL